MLSNIQHKGLITSQLNDLNTLHSVIVDELKQNDILTKYKAYYLTSSSEIKPDSSLDKTFGIPLEQVPLSRYTLASGHTVLIPSLLVQAYSIIKSHAKEEGIFRLSGNIQLQKNIVNRIDRGGSFNSNNDVHDVTSLVKQFFRDLPMVILSEKEMQETLCKCLKTGIYASRCLRVALLMLPPLDLYTFVSFLQLLKGLTKMQSHNKMDAYALAVVTAPNLLPVLELEEIDKIETFIQIIKMLIENADKVGIIPKKTLTRYCLAKKKSRPIKIIPDDHETIVLYFFLNGRWFSSPYKYKTCVGVIRAEVNIKTAKNCCKKYVQFHNFRIHEIDGKLLRSVEMIYDEAVYVLVPLKEPFKRGNYETAFDDYISKRINKSDLKLINIEKVIDLPCDNVLHERNNKDSGKSTKLSKIKTATSNKSKNTLSEDDPQERLAVEVRKAKEREEIIRIKQEEKQLMDEKLIKELKEKPKNIYDPYKKYKTDNIHNGKQKDAKKRSHMKKNNEKDKKALTPEPIWKRPTPVEVVNLIKQETEKGRLRRGLTVEPSASDEKAGQSRLAKKKLKKQDSKTPKVSYISMTTLPVKSWERQPLIMVKGADKELKRGESIRKAAEPPADDESNQLPGIKGFNKALQVDFPVEEDEQTTTCCGSKKSKYKSPKRKSLELEESRSPVKSKSVKDIESFKGTALKTNSNNNPNHFGSQTLKSYSTVSIEKSNQNSRYSQ